jgi:hypothetical protein
VNAGRAAIGAVLIGVGAVYLLDAGGALEAGRTLREWWPLMVVLLGAFQVASERRVRLVSGVLLFGGMALLLATTGAVGSVDFGVVWPILLILAGLALLIGWSRRQRGIAAADEVTGLAMLAAGHCATSSQNFKRAAVTAVLGGMTLDLSEARPAEGGARVSATAILGGVDVVVPPGWRVVVKGLPLFGGWDDTTARSPVEPDAPRVDVQALLLFGGLEVKHPRRWG